MQWVVTRLVGLSAALLVTAGLLFLATMHARTSWPAAKQPHEVVIKLGPLPPRASP